MIVEPHIESFCDTWNEGIRVEYKRVIKEGQIPKTLSSFANSMGGILLIGVAADDGKPIKPINGFLNEPGIEERIVQSALIGIHPPLNPEIRIVAVPNNPSSIVVVVRVHESEQAPHSIMNTTRTYIRTSSVSQPYEFNELAEINRIEYLLKRREEPQKKRVELIAAAENRSKGHGRFAGNPNISISIAPAFPYRPIISLDRIYSFATNGEQQKIFGAPARIIGGVASIAQDLYTELNQYGVIFHWTILNLKEQEIPALGKVPNQPEKTHIQFINFAPLIIDCDRILTMAKKFYQEAKYLGNIIVTVSLDMIQNRYLQYSNADFSDPLWLRDKFSRDPTVFSSAQVLSHDSQRNNELVLTPIFRELLWVFQLTPADLEERITRILIG